MHGNTSKWMETEFRGCYGHIIYLDHIVDSKSVLRAKIMKQSPHCWEIYLEAEWNMEGRSIRGWTYFESEFGKTRAIKKTKKIMEDCLIQDSSLLSRLRL